MNGHHDAIPAIDLFAGAGGLSLGAALAGLDVRLMVDNDDAACDTLRANSRRHTGVVLEADISGLDGKTLRTRAGLTRDDPLIIVGGAPCQPFSKAAYWTDPGEDARYRRARSRGEDAAKPMPILHAKPDSRRSLVAEYWRLVEETQADAFLFENVPSILHPRNRVVVDGLVASATSAGYCVRVVKANAADFGVAQRRQRVFVLGSRRRRPHVPAATHAVRARQGGGLPPAVTAGAAISHLDRPRFAEPEEVVEGRWAQHLAEIPPGSNYKFHTEWAGHPEPTFVAETRFWNSLPKLSPDLPSWTIAASPGPWTGPFHWRSRRLRTTEMAALQSFPADYRFAGSRRERVRQIGNAVPPRLAAHMAAAVAATFGGDPAPAADLLAATCAG
ncbi:MAG: DNA cytosine methyltransferase [Actinomycetes bacterium]